MRFVGLAVLVLVVPGCGLTLDYDPPTDAGGPGVDGARLDAPLPACTSDVECDDGDACTGIEQCLEGACSPGAPVECDDGDRCNGEERCDPATGACEAGEALTCDDDGDLCNGPELCDPMIGCVHGAAPVCDDGLDCTVDDCDPEAGCTSVPDDARCMAGAGGTCDPENGCTYDECNATWCNDLERCNPGYCDGNTCVRERVTCPSGRACCNGDCEPVDCEDGDPCTANLCIPRIGCVSMPQPGACDDGIACTGAGFCREGVCQRGSDACAEPVSPCHVGMCDPVDGCIEVPTTGERCDDGDSCTVADRCDDGVCAPLGIVLCDDADDCTADDCDPMSGCRFVPRPDGSPCYVGMTPGVCRGGSCMEATPCPALTADCDGDSDCECLGRCAPSPTGGLRCVLSSLDCTLVGCTAGQECCNDPRSPTSGTCVADDCSTCCAASAF